MLAGVEYRKIDDEGFHIAVHGLERTLYVDHIVMCAGQDPLAELMPDTDGSNGQPVPVLRRFQKIGGAALAAELDAKRAIREGAELAASL